MEKLSVLSNIFDLTDIKQTGNKIFQFVKENPEKEQELCNFLIKSFDQTFERNISLENINVFLAPTSGEKARFHAEEVFHALVHEVVLKNAYKLFNKHNEIGQFPLQMNLEEDIQHFMEGGTHAKIKGDFFFIKDIFDNVENNIEILGRRLLQVEKEVLRFPANLIPLANDVISYAKQLSSYQLMIFKRKQEELNKNTELDSQEKLDEISYLKSNLFHIVKRQTSDYFDKAIRLHKFPTVVPEDMQIRYKLWTLKILRFCHNNASK